MKLAACALFTCGSLFAQAASTPTTNTNEWNYDRFRQTYPDQVCRVRTSQSGRETLEQAVEFRREKEEKAKDNAELRGRVRAAWRDLLGPARRNLGPLNLSTLEEREFPKYTRKKIEYHGDQGEPVRAYLFVPTRLAGAKAPGLLCLHQTAREGKDQASGLDSTKPELAYGPLLAERGYVTLCPDAICFGERYQVGGSFYCHYGDAVRIYAGDAGRSIMSKMIDDAMRAVDVLCTLPEVDRDKIGSIGHSHGGYGTLFAMAFDERIKAGVVSCGFTCFRSDPTPERWFRRTALIPRLGGFEGQMKETPVDFHHLFAAIAPRSLFLSVALQDKIFPNVGDVEWIGKDLKTVYERENAGENFRMHNFDGPHSFTPEARDLAWAFLDRHLKSAGGK